MVQPAQGFAAASAMAAGILGISASLTGQTFDLNGVSLPVVGVAFNFPAQPDPDTPEFTWATTSLAYNRTVLMQDGATWHLWKPPIRQSDGSWQIWLRPPTGTQQATFQVPADQLDTPIWNTGTTLPPTQDDPPTVDPNPPTSPPVETTYPQDPLYPADPPGNGDATPTPTPDPTPTPTQSPTDAPEPSESPDGQ